MSANLRRLGVVIGLSVAAVGFIAVSPNLMGDEVGPDQRPTGGEAFDGWVSGRWQGVNVYQRRSASYDGAQWQDLPAVVPSYSRADFDAIAATGANLVVLSHPGIFTERPPYRLDQPVLDNLTRLVDLAGDAGLRVVIAARTGPGRSEITFSRDLVGQLYDPSDLLETVWSDAETQQAWIQMWTVTADAFALHEALVGYVPMVEPNASAVLGIPDRVDFLDANQNGLADWGLFQSPICEAIRQVDPDTPILIEPDGWADPNWIDSLPPPAVDNTVYSVHLYTPFQYAVEGRSPLSAREAVERFADRLNEAKAKADERQVPLAVLEFGANEDQDQAADYLEGVLAAIDAAEVSSAMWLWESAESEGWPHDPLAMSAATPAEDARRSVIARAWAER